MRKTSIRLGPDSSITLDPYNARVVKLSNRKKKGLLHYDEKGLITTVDYGDIEFAIGSQIYIREPYKIQKIEKAEDGYLLHTAELTKSSYFLLPMLGENRSYFLWNSLFVNCFIDTEDIAYKLCEHHLYLLYRFSGKRAYTEFEEKLQNHGNYVKTFDVDNYQVLYAFKIPKNCYTDFELFRKGKFSKLSANYKEVVMHFHDAPHDSELSQILFKAPSRRSKLSKDLSVKLPQAAELYDKPRMQTETFYNKYLVKNDMIPNVKFDKTKEKV